MEASMTGVIISIVASGGIALFIAHNYCRDRIGIGLAIMILFPLLSCGGYLYFTAPYFNPHIVKQAPEKIEASPAATLEEIKAMEGKVEDNPDDVDPVLALAGAYMSREDYDAAISLLMSKELKFPGKEIKTQLATSYFAKGLLFAEQGNFESALSTLRQAQQIAPTDAPFLPDLKHFIKMIEKQLADEEEPQQLPAD